VQGLFCFLVDSRERLWELWMESDLLCKILSVWHSLTSRVNEYVETCYKYWVNFWCRNISKHYNHKSITLSITQWIDGEIVGATSCRKCCWSHYSNCYTCCSVLTAVAATMKIWPNYNHRYHMCVNFHDVCNARSGIVSVAAVVVATVSATVLA